MLRREKVDAHRMTNLRVPSLFSLPMGALVSKHDATFNPDSWLGSGNANLHANFSHQRSVMILNHVVKKHTSCNRKQDKQMVPTGILGCCE